VRHARARSTPAPRREVQGRRPPAPAWGIEPNDLFHVFPIRGYGPRPAGDSTLLCMPRAGGEEGRDRCTG
jgi:hypothetical protein